MKNLFAYTETGVAGYPGYVSINCSAAGVHTVSVRTRDAASPSTLELSPERMEVMASDILGYLHGEQPQPGPYRLLADAARELVQAIRANDAAEVTRLVPMVEYQLGQA